MVTGMWVVLSLLALLPARPVKIRRGSSRSTYVDHIDRLVEWGIGVLFPYCAGGTLASHTPRCPTVDVFCQLSNRTSQESKDVSLQGRAVILFVKPARSDSNEFQRRAYCLFTFTAALSCSR